MKRHDKLQESIAKVVEQQAIDILEAIETDRDMFTRCIEPYTNYSDELYLLLENYKRSVTKKVAKELEQGYTDAEYIERLKATIEMISGKCIDMKKELTDAKREIIALTPKGGYEQNVEVITDEWGYSRQIVHEMGQ